MVLYVASTRAIVRASLLGRTRQCCHIAVCPILEVTGRPLQRRWQHVDVRPTTDSHGEHSPPSEPLPSKQTQSTEQIQIADQARSIIHDAVQHMDQRRPSAQLKAIMNRGRRTRALTIRFKKRLSLAIEAEKREMEKLKKGKDRPTLEEREYWEQEMKRLSGLFVEGDGQNRGIDDRRFSSDEERGIANTYFTSPYARRDLRIKASRAVVNKRLLDEARQRKADLEADGEANVTGMGLPAGSGTGLYPREDLNLYVDFVRAKMVYPPRHRYPPSSPRLVDIDPEMAARVFRLLRNCDVKWIEGVGWRKTMHGANHYADRCEPERMDNGHSLEWLGDAVMGLICRSCLLMRFPRRIMPLYVTSASWLVSNEVFGHIYQDAGLEQEREWVGAWLQRRSKQEELDRMKDLIDADEFRRRQDSPLPPLALPVPSHQHQADLFEAYVGACCLTLGFTETSKWCSALYEPWLDRLERTDGFLSSRHLSDVGNIRSQIEKQIRQEIQAEMRAKHLGDRNAFLDPITPWQRWMRKMATAVFGKRTLPEQQDR